MLDNKLLSLQPAASDVDRVLTWLTEHARPRILAIARPDSCIFSTRIAVGVLRRLHIGASPLAVRVSIFNPLMSGRIAAWTASSGGIAPPFDVVQKWFRDGSGCYSVGLGHGDPRPGSYAGHLVAAVSGGGLLDLSLDQANRREHGITLGPLRTHASAEFFKGELAHVERMNGSTLRYQIHDNNDWMKAPDWNIRKRSRPLIDELVAEIRGCVGAAGAAGR